MLYLLRSYGKDNKTILKVGYASNLDDRFNQYLSHNPFIEKLSEQEGTLGDERLLHLYLHSFGYCEWRDEWYKDIEEVIGEFNNFNLQTAREKVWNSRDKVFTLKSINYYLDLYFDLYTEFGKDLIPMRVSEKDDSGKIIETKPNGTKLDEKLFELYEDRFIYFKIRDISTELSDKLRLILSKVESINFFTDKMRYLCETAETLTETELTVILERLPVYFKDYYNVLGPAKIRSLGYQKSDLEREYKRLSRNQNIDIEEIIYSNFKEGERYSNPELKEKLKRLYIESGYNKSPKATDIQEYFETKKVNVPNKETGKRDNGLELIKKLK